MSSNAPLGDGFDQPTVTSDASIAFGGEMSALLPPYDSIPEDFKAWNGRGEASAWCRFVSDWFFSGVQLSRLTPRSDIDPAAAIRHAKAIMSSWAPKHEHKEAGVAWLLSRWFEAVATDD